MQMACAMDTNQFRRWVEEFFFELLRKSNLARFELTQEIYRADPRGIRLASDFCDSRGAMSAAAQSLGLDGEGLAARWDEEWSALTADDVYALARPAVLGAYRLMGDSELVGRARLFDQRGMGEDFARVVLRERFGVGDVTHVAEQIKVNRRGARGASGVVHERAGDLFEADA